MLRMQMQEKNGGKKNSLSNPSSSCTDLHELSSKSLLANVLDMNDDFGVIGSKLNNYHKGSSSRLKSRTFNESSNLSNYQTTYLKRENSSLSQCDNCGDSIFGSKSEIHVLRKSLHLILKELRHLTQKMKDDDEDEDKALNWKFAAMVIDRLCMVFFMGATLISTIVILLTSKNFFKLN